MAGWEGSTLPLMKAQFCRGSSPTLKEEVDLLPAAQSEVRDQLVDWNGIGQNPAGQVLVWLQVALQLIQRASRKR